MPDEHRAYSTRCQVSITEVGELIAPLNILPLSTAIMLPPPERKETETRAERPMAAAVSARAATAGYLQSRVRSTARSRVPLTLQQLRFQVQKSGTSVKTSSPVIHLLTDGPD